MAVLDLPVARMRQGDAFRKTHVHAGVPAACGGVRHFWGSGIRRPMNQHTFLCSQKHITKTNKKKQICTVMTATRVNHHCTDWFKKMFLSLILTFSAVISVFKFLELLVAFWKSSMVFLLNLFSRAQGTFLILDPEVAYLTDDGTTRKNNDWETDNIARADLWPLNSRVTARFPRECYSNWGAIFIFTINNK